MADKNENIRELIKLLKIENVIDPKIKSMLRMDLSRDILVPIFDNHFSEKEIKKLLKLFKNKYIVKLIEEVPSMYKDVGKMISNDMNVYIEDQLMQTPPPEGVSWN